MGGGAPSSSGEHPAADRAAELLRGLERLKTDEPRLAEPMERLMARVIDCVAWLVIFLAVTAAGFAVARALGLTEDLSEPALGQTRVRQEMHPVASWATLAALIAVAWAAEVPATATSGSHFAKRRFQLLVVGPDGGPPGLARSSVRWFASWAPSVLAFALFWSTVGSGWAFLFLALELAALLVPGAMFFDAENRGLHDRLAGTRVLSER